MTEIITDSGLVRQIVYRYQPSERGSGEFAVWHVRTDRFTVYGPEGDVRRQVTLNGVSKAYADTAAADYGEVVSEHHSASLYPRRGYCGPCGTPEHDTCGMVPGCPCCDDTITKLAEED